MAKKKLSARQVQELRDAYESWNPHDPDSESANDLAARFGISKQTLYTYRDEWLRDDAKKRVKHDTTAVAGQAEAIVYLTAELVQARARIQQLEAELANRG